jgi:hypothetical protein
VWVEDLKEGTFLVHGLESVMREIFGNVIEKIPTNNIYDAGPIRSFCVVTETDLEDLLCIHSGIIYIKCIAILRCNGVKM